MKIMSAIAHRFRQFVGLPAHIQAPIQAHAHLQARAQNRAGDAPVFVRSQAPDAMARHPRPQALPAAVRHHDGRVRTHRPPDGDARPSAGAEVAEAELPAKPLARRLDVRHPVAPINVQTMAQIDAIVQNAIRIRKELEQSNAKTLAELKAHARSQPRSRAPAPPLLQTRAPALAPVPESPSAEEVLARLDALQAQVLRDREALAKRVAGIRARSTAFDARKP